MSACVRPSVRVNGFRSIKPKPHQLSSPDFVYWFSTTVSNPGVYIVRGGKSSHQVKTCRWSVPVIFLFFSIYSPSNLPAISLSAHKLCTRKHNLKLKMKYIAGKHAHRTSPLYSMEVTSLTSYSTIHLPPRHFPWTTGLTGLELRSHSATWKPLGILICFMTPCRLLKCPGVDFTKADYIQSRLKVNTKVRLF